MINEPQARGKEARLAITQAIKCCPYSVSVWGALAFPAQPPNSPLIWAAFPGSPNFPNILCFVYALL